MFNDLANKSEITNLHTEIWPKNDNDSVENHY
jgi:hypothetical protein